MNVKHIALFLLLLMGLSYAALGDFNASATTSHFILVNITDPFDHYRALIDLNVSAFAGSLGANCDNYQLTLNVSGVETLTYSNMSAVPYNSLNDWSSCNSTHANLRFPFNATASTDNQLVAILYILPSSANQWPFSVTFDRLDTNNTGYICATPSTLNTTRRTLDFTSESGSRCNFNLTTIDGIFTTRQAIPTPGGGTSLLAFHSNASVPSPTDWNGANPNRPGLGDNAEFRFNNVQKNATGSTWDETNGFWRWKIDGCLNEIYYEQNSSPALTVFNCTNNNPEATLFGWSAADGGSPILGQVFSWSWSYTPLEDFWTRAYNESEAMWIATNASVVPATIVTIHAPANATTTNATPSSSFNVTGSQPTYTCWRILDGTTTSLGTINNNTNFTQVLPSLSIGGHNYTITCFNSTTNVSDEVIFAEVTYILNNNVSKDAINETETAIFNSTIQLNTLISNVTAILWHNNTQLVATQLSLVNFLATFGRTTDIPIALSNNTNITYAWQFTFEFSNGTNSTVNDTVFSQSVYFAYFLSNFTPNATSLLEGGLFGSNISLITLLQKAEINSTVFLHNSSARSENSTYPFHTNIQSVPNMTDPSSQTFGAFVNITLTFGGFTRNITSTNATITVGSFNLTNCTTGTIALTYFLKDEITFELLNGTFEKAFEFRNGNVIKNFSYIWNNTYVAHVCISPAWASFIVTSVEQHDFQNASIDYKPRSYFLSNATINNVTMTINQFLLNDTFAKLTKFTILDENNQPLSGVILRVLRFRIGNNSLETVAMGSTATDGITNIYLQVVDVFYSFRVVAANGSLLHATDAKQTISCDPATALCEKTLIVISGLIGEFWTYQGSLVHGCNYNNNSFWFTCPFDDLSGLARSCTINVKRLTPLGPIENCTSTVSSTSGTVACNLGNVSGNIYNIKFFCTYAATDYVILEENFDFTEYGSFGDIGEFMALLIMFFLPTIGFFSMPVAVMLAFVSLVASWQMGLYNIGMGAIVGSGLLVVVVIYRLRA